MQCTCHILGSSRLVLSERLFTLINPYSNLTVCLLHRFRRHFPLVRSPVFARALQTSVVPSNFFWVRSKYPSAVVASAWLIECRRICGTWIYVHCTDNTCAYSARSRTRTDGEDHSKCTHITPSRCSLCVNLHVLCVVYNVWMFPRILGSGNEIRIFCLCEGCSWTCTCPLFEGLNFISRFCDFVWLR